MTAMRSRWAAVGAAVAITLGAGGISLGQAAISSGDKPVFVGIEPCRLVDTRPGDNNIGGRTTPLGANDTLTLQVTGSTGQCSGIPTDAVAAAMNVTAIQPTAQSFLSVYPADADLPLASNLNWAAGDPPTPNKVDVKLATTGADTGAVKLTNSVGTVHIAADLVGYYIDHTHDDRYYTKNQTDQQRALTKFLSINVYADPGLNFDERWASLADAGVGGSNVDVDFNFTVPPDFTPGSPVEIRVLAYARDATAFPCNGDLEENWLSAMRADVGRLPAGSPRLSPNVNAHVFTEADVPHEFVFTTNPTLQLQPGDSVGFGLLMFAPATRCNIVISGVSIHYS